MAMTDGGRFSSLLIAAACLAVLSVAYDAVIAPIMSRFAETARRRERYEKAVNEKGLSLHPGMYWKEKE
jgi:lipopolysaccharide export LptBFGC system permease protein LptF